MPAKKTLTSLLLAIFTKRSWGRRRARTERICSGVASPETTPLSPAARLPQEVIEIIIGYLNYYAPSVWACTLICRSWYTAAVPHLYPTLCIAFDDENQRFEWSNPIQHMQTPTFLPFDKSVRISSRPQNALFPRLPNSNIIRGYPALNNIQFLEIHELDIPRLTRNIRRNFSHFLPKVRSLSLMAPKGSCQQIIFFIGLFRNLENIFLSEPDIPGGELPDDPKLIPPFIPPLRGRLTARSIASAGLFKDMIHSFGRIQFHRFDLYDVPETQLLLDACVNTLKGLYLYPDNLRAKYSLMSIDLSQNKLLRWLGITAESIDRALAGGQLYDTLLLLECWLGFSRPTTQLQVVVCFVERDFRGLRKKPGSNYPSVCGRSQAEEVEEALSHRLRFGLIRKMRERQDFWLVLDVSVWQPVGWYSMQMLEEAVSMEERFGGPFQRTILYRPRTDLQAIRL